MAVVARSGYGASGRPAGPSPQEATEGVVVFKRLMQAMGVGGPSVETVLANANCRPGGYLEGRVQVAGGDHPVDVSYVALGLVTRVEVESATTVQHHPEFQHR
jgi:sporulation-control protein spo0M